MRWTCGSSSEEGRVGEDHARAGRVGKAGDQLDAAEDADDHTSRDTELA